MWGGVKLTLHVEHLVAIHAIQCAHGRSHHAASQGFTNPSGQYFRHFLADFMVTDAPSRPTCSYSVPTGHRLPYMPPPSLSILISCEYPELSCFVIQHPQAHPRAFVNTLSYAVNSPSFLFSNDIPGWPRTTHISFFDHLAPNTTALSYQPEFSSYPAAPYFRFYCA